MTPGPWFVEAGGARLINTNVHVISANDGLGPVAYSTKENAALVSAAPDLLAVLKSIVAEAELPNPQDEDSHLPDRLIHAAIDAIQKAEA